MGTSPFESVLPYSLSVVPLFVMMGVFASYAGLSRQLYDVAYAFLGHYRGGLALATVGACAGFGAICGSALATAATMCRVAPPEIDRKSVGKGKSVTVRVDLGGRRITKKQNKTSTIDHNHTHVTYLRHNNNKI